MNDETIVMIPRFHSKHNHKKCINLYLMIIKTSRNGSPGFKAQKQSVLKFLVKSST